MKQRFLLTLLLYFAISSISAQIFHSPFIIEWRDIGISKPYAMDCFYNDSCPNIPFKTFKIKVPLNSEVESASVEIDKTTEILNISLKKDDSIPNDF
ncbi:MAG TPA: hypothetical protein PK990_10490, partial [Salinivirgaceae bacterium]|nr:hypothetical protein [Salinivirgaceae bacterium]